MSMDEALSEVRHQAIPKTEAAETGLTALQLALQEQAGHLAAAQMAILELQPKIKNGVGIYFARAAGEYNTASAALRQAENSIASVFDNEHPKKQEIDKYMGILAERDAHAAALVGPYTEKIQGAIDQIHQASTTIQESRVLLGNAEDGIAFRDDKGEALPTLKRYAASLEGQR